MHNYTNRAIPKQRRFRDTICNADYVGECVWYVRGAVVFVKRTAQFIYMQSVSTIMRIISYGTAAFDGRTE